jgi:aarF domain-containing kinase
VAAASIGQVYKAVLKENGDLVALKIQRPGCEEIIALDLYVLRWWSGVYNGIFKILNRDIDLQSIIDDFGELIYREIDYVAEAANAQRFNELYAGNTDVFVPKIYSDYTTSKVLTMEWVDGFRLTDSASLRRFGLEESKLVNTLVQCSLRQILGTSRIRIIIIAGCTVFAKARNVVTRSRNVNVFCFTTQKMDSFTPTRTQ